VCWLGCNLMTLTARAWSEVPFPAFAQVGKMCAALGVWSIAVAAFYASTCSGRKGAVHEAGRRSRLMSLVGRASLMVALVLYSPASKTAIGLLNCTTVSMSPAGVLALDGGPRIIASTAQRDAATLSVSVLVQVRHGFWGEERGCL
jgi:hypothetical protein